MVGGGPIKTSCKFLFLQARFPPRTPHFPTPSYLSLLSKGEDCCSYLSEGFGREAVYPPNLKWSGEGGVVKKGTLLTEAKEEEEEEEERVSGERTCT